VQEQVVLMCQKDELAGKIGLAELRALAGTQE